MPAGTSHAVPVLSALIDHIHNCLALNESKTHDCQFHQPSRILVPPVVPVLHDLIGAVAPADVAGDLLDCAAVDEFRQVGDDPARLRNRLRIDGRFHFGRFRSRFRVVRQDYILSGQGVSLVWPVGCVALHFFTKSSNRCALERFSVNMLTPGARLIPADLSSV